MHVWITSKMSEVKNNSVHQSTGHIPNLLSVTVKMTCSLFIVSLHCFLLDGIDQTMNIAHCIEM